MTKSTAQAISAKLERINPVKVALDIEVPWNEVDQVLKRSVQRVQRGAKLKGFRQGKVPEQMVRQLFGSQIQHDAANILIEQSLLFAFAEHKITPVSTPELGHPHIHEGKPFSFRAELEVQPLITDIVTKGLKVEVASRTYDAKEPEEELQRLRQRHAEFREPEPSRPVQANDRVLLDYRVFINGSEKPDLGAKDAWFDLNEARMRPELKAALQGAAVGETREATLRYDDDYPNQELKGQDARFVLDIKNIQEVILPELNDEFAKDCGDYADLNTLREAIENRLKLIAKMEEEEETRQRVLDKLIELNPIPLPPSMVEDRVHRMEHELAAYRGGRKLSAEEAKETHQALHQRAEHQLRAGFLFSALARKEKIDVGKEDIDRFVENESKLRQQEPAKIRAGLNKETLPQVQSRLLEDKIFDYLLQQAKIVRTSKKSKEPTDER